MSTKSRIYGVRLKAERAKKHIRDLDTAIAAFLADEPYTIGTKPHPVAEIDHTTLYVASVKPIPDDSPLLLGDAIHNLRSSLDHLAWQLVEAGGGSPTKDTYFPITDALQKYQSAIGKGEIKKIAPSALQIIEAIQPYNTVDQNLWLLHHLDIVDKHRLRLSAGLHMDKWGVQFSIGTTMWFNGDRFVLLNAGDEIVNIPTRTYERTPHKNFQLGADVAFGKSEVAEGELVLYTVKKLADLIDGIPGRFEPFLT